RPGITPEAEALLGVLTETLGGAEAVTVRPGELREGLRVRLGWRDAPSAETIAAWLRRLGVRRTGKGRDGAEDEIQADRLHAVTERYAPETTITPSLSHSNRSILLALDGVTGLTGGKHGDGCAVTGRIES